MTVSIYRDGVLVELTDAEWAAMNPPGTAPPAPVPPPISDRQFGQGLWTQGIITFAECQAFVSMGMIPAAMQTLIDALPDDDTGRPTARKTAIVFVSGAKEYDRDNPLVDQLGTAYGWTPAQLDANWIAWALL